MGTADDVSGVEEVRIGGDRVRPQAHVRPDDGLAGQHVELRWPIVRELDAHLGRSRADAGGHEHEEPGQHGQEEQPGSHRDTL